jgi:B9 domain-containing protein 1
VHVPRARSLNTNTTPPPLQTQTKKISGCDNAYCKFELVSGEDWALLDGLEHGVTQSARAALQAAPSSTCASPPLVWNHPLDAAWRSTNAAGWPQIVVAVYGADALGRDVLRGYGGTHVPTAPGR